MTDLTVVPDVEAFARTCAGLFVSAAREAIAARGKFVVALTGGSTPGPIHQLLAQPPFRDDVDWRRVEVLFGDERAVPPTDKQSNFRAANADLLSHVPLPATQIHRMQGDRADLAAAAADYERELLDVCGGEIDLLFVGLGKDAHVLSLHPGAAAIDERARWVVDEIDPPMDPRLSRITCTPRVIERARLVLAIATGEGKRDALQKALHGAESPKEVPAHLLRRAKAVRWVVDRAANGG